MDLDCLLVTLGDFPVTLTSSWPLEGVNGPSLEHLPLLSYGIKPHNLPGFPGS